MKNIDILYIRYVYENKEMEVGGIQTYITDLCEVLINCGCNVRIVQFSEAGLDYTLDSGVRVVGYKIDAKDRFQALYDASLKSQNGETLTIFATDTMIPRKIHNKAMAIQHGIFWDIPINSDGNLMLQVFKRAYQAYKTIRRLQLMDAVVCVDYNFLNWYRTQVNKTVEYAEVIPNYTQIAEEYEKPEDCVNIIFARRLVPYRGTRIFTKAIKRILTEGYNVKVTVAGTGADEGWMKEQLGEFSQVEFINYQNDESLKNHEDKHIAVVPTVGYEGTSLSLLEAMSAQCAVVCTNVGGMTNIVIDGYNGLMINADEDELYASLKKLVEDKALRAKLSKNAYETVKQGFSLGKWQDKWREVIKSVI